MRNKKLSRRGFLGKAAGVGLGGLALPAFPRKGVAESGGARGFDPGGQGTAQSSTSAVDCAPRSEAWKSTSDQPPRKVILGTAMQPWEISGIREAAGAVDGDRGADGDTVVKCQLHNAAPVRGVENIGFA
jgi:hypothetical protein